jgi:CubicO group peptidase (beta-lactamase class C family)
MNRPLRAMALALLVFTGVSAAADYDFSALRARIATAVEKGELAGGSVLVMHHGKVVFREAFGLSDVENAIPFRTDSICQIASSTKWVSGATLMAAVEEGKLSLDEPLGKYFPPFGDMPIAGIEAKGSPTIRQGFSHTAGLPAFADRSITRDVSVPESVGLLAKTIHTLERLPGSGFLYGNTGMQITGGIIANVTGKSFQDYMREKILVPLDMKDTSFNPTGEALKRIGNIYIKKPGGGFRKLSGPPDGNIKGALVPGGLYSTLDDYAHFLTMMLHDGDYAGRRVLSAKAALETQKDQTGGAPVVSSPYRNQKGYGLGAAVMGLDAKGAPSYIGDGGAWGTYGWIERDRDLVAVFFAQHQLNQIYNLSNIEVPALVRKAVDGL